MRRSSLSSVGVAIDREVDSQYDDIKIVADNIDGVNALVGSDVLALSAAELAELATLTDAADIVENLAFSAVTLAPGSQATVGQVGSDVTIGVPSGATGAAGRDGIVPVLDFSYVNGQLIVEVTGYEALPDIEDIVEEI